MKLAVSATVALIMSVIIASAADQCPLVGAQITAENAKQTLELIEALRARHDAVSVLNKALSSNQQRATFSASALDNEEPNRCVGFEKGSMSAAMCHPGHSVSLLATKELGRALLTVAEAQLADAICRLRSLGIDAR